MISRRPPCAAWLAAPPAVSGRTPPRKGPSNLARTHSQAVVALLAAPRLAAPPPAGCLGRTASSCGRPGNN
jgi:hypothetical protein